MKIYYKTGYNSPFGKIIMASDGDGLLGVWFLGQKYFMDKIEGEIKEDDSLEIFNKTKEWLNEYFEGKKPEISKLNLKAEGSKFRQKVWGILTKIPYGEVITYGKIAQIIAQENGKDKISAQAVGGAVGHNPVSIIIPCHRVIGSNGALTGYAAGIETKIKLLEHEGTDTSLFHFAK